MQITLDIQDNIFNEFINSISKFKDKITVKDENLKDILNANNKTENLSDVLKYALEIKKQLPKDFDPLKEKEEYFHDRFKI
jgi:hypothetical protein